MAPFERMSGNTQGEFTMGKISKIVEITLDKPRRLLFNLNAMAAYERETGKNFLDLPKENVSATLLRTLLWAGLMHEDKSLTIEQVGAFMDSDNMVAIQDKIVEAASSNVPEVTSIPEGSINPNELKPEAPPS